MHSRCLVPTGSGVGNRFVRIDGTAVDFRIEWYDLLACTPKYDRNPHVEFLV